MGREPLDHVGHAPPPRAVPSDQVAALFAPTQGRGSGGRPLSELRSTGLLWLINRVVFHPRGFALALHQAADGTITEWSLEGDGSEIWRMGAGIDEDEHLTQVRELLGR